MNNFKSIGMGIGISAVAAMMLSNPVNGMINFNSVKNSSYSSEIDDTLYPEDEIDDTLYKEADYDNSEDEKVGFCKIKEDEVDEFYGADEALKKYAKYYLRDGYEVYDVELLTKHLKFGLEDPDGNLFEEGIYVTEDFYDSMLSQYVVKCTEDEYNDFKDSFNFVWVNNGHNYYYHYLNDSVYHRISYDYDNGVMIFTEKLL